MSPLWLRSDSRDPQGKQIRSVVRTFRSEAQGYNKCSFEPDSRETANVSDIYHLACSLVPEKYGDFHETLGPIIRAVRIFDKRT